MNEAERVELHHAHRELAELTTDYFEALIEQGVHPDRAQWLAASYQNQRTLMLWGSTTSESDDGSD